MPHGRLQPGGLAGRTWTTTGSQPPGGRTDDSDPDPRTRVHVCSRASRVRAQARAVKRSRSDIAPTSRKRLPGRDRPPTIPRPGSRRRRRCPLTEASRRCAAHHWHPCVVRGWTCATCVSPLGSWPVLRPHALWRELLPAAARVEPRVPHRRAVRPPRPPRHVPPRSRKRQPRPLPRHRRPLASYERARSSARFWPIEPRNDRSRFQSRDRGAGAHGGLAACGTARMNEIVLEFTAPYGCGESALRTDRRADPSNKIVPLRGSSFLQVVVIIHGAGRSLPGDSHHAVFRTAHDDAGIPGQSNRSRSPETLRPCSALASASDRVLPAGQVSRLSSPDRPVVDVAETPAWPMWPEDNSLRPRNKRHAGHACDQGHQPGGVAARSLSPNFTHAPYSDGAAQS